MDRPTGREVEVCQSQSRYRIRFNATERERKEGIVTDAEKRLLELLKSLGPEKKEAFIKFGEGLCAWHAFTSEEKDRIIDALIDFLEEIKTQKGKKE
jgi:hypothetical protein